MKKILAGFAVLPLMWIAACSKGDSTGPKTPENGWLFNGSPYNVKKATCYNADFYAVDSFSNTVSVQFYTTPQTDGVYDVVNNIYPYQLTEKESGITFQNAQGRYYYSTGNDHIKLQVKLTGGRVHVTIPETWLKSEAGDSLVFAADMTQTP